MNTEGINETNQYLTFKLDQEMFAINVVQVKEVLDISVITRVPRAPEFMRGVINVRGSVVPVMDLKMKLGMKMSEKTINSRIVVIELSIDGDRIVLGALADSVHDVMDIETENIEAPPGIGARWKTEVIRGIGKSDGDFIIILDIDRIVSASELTIIQEAGNIKDQPKDEGSAA